MESESFNRSTLTGGALGSGGGGCDSLLCGGHDEKSPFLFVLRQFTIGRNFSHRYRSLRMLPAFIYRLGFPRGFDVKSLDEVLL